jgi:hypothetical protein
MRECTPRHRNRATPYIVPSLLRQGGGGHTTFRQDTQLAQYLASDRYSRQGRRLVEDDLYSNLDQFVFPSHLATQSALGTGLHSAALDGDTTKTKVREATPYFSPLARAMFPATTDQLFVLPAFANHFPGHSSSRQSLKSTEEAFPRTLHHPSRSSTLALEPRINESNRLPHLKPYPSQDQLALGHPHALPLGTTADIIQAVSFLYSTPHQLLNDSAVARS